MAKHPKYSAIKVQDDDKVYDFVKGRYNRFIWTWNDAPKHGDDHEYKHIREMEEYEPEEELEGGLADAMSLEEIAELHDVPFEQIEKQVAKGIAVEMEHTNDTTKANEIAKDHVVEDPAYYDKLEDVEDVDEYTEVMGMGRPGFEGPATIGYTGGPLSKKTRPGSGAVDPDTGEDESEEKFVRRRIKRLEDF